jgi:beta-glucosidase
VAGSTAVTSTRIDDLAERMTVAEQAALTAGSDTWHTSPVERLGIGRLKVTDGPTGARGDLVSGERAACFPVGVCLGASWDPGLLEEIGAALAVEAKDKGAHVLLGPTVNLQRSPLAGRHFECYSEDPWLTGVLATAWIQGLQAGGVGASIKHLVANDSEYERMAISSEVDERTLREMLLRPFELAVADADPWTVMAAYNRVNGTFACEHRWLLTDVLRDEWGWPGLVVSDWLAAHSTGPTAEAGCDLEMPGPGAHLGPKLAEAVEAGEVDDEVLCRRATTVLHLLERAGVLDDPTEPPEVGIDRPEHRELARRAAVNGTVLLRNEPADAGQPLLPLDPDTIGTVALIGPSAERLTFQGGGSSQVVSHRVPPFPEALAGRLPDADITTEPGCRVHRYMPEIDAASWEADDDGRIATLSWFDAPSPTDEPASSRRVRSIGAQFFPTPDGLDAATSSCRYEGSFVPERSGRHAFSIISTGRARLHLDDTEVVDAWTDPTPGDWLFGMGFAEVIGTVELTAGQPVDVTLDYSSWGDGRPHGIRVGMLPPVPDDLLARAEAAAASADVAVVVVGTSTDFETEGNDRETMDLPGAQDELVARVVAANPRTVVIINAGSPVSMPWAEDISALAQVWFPGMEGSAALADVLVGAAEPGGRLPHTIPVRAEDGPAYASAPASYPGVDGTVSYVEGVLMGYRGYDAAETEPRFCFGHGLGYTTWEMSDARAKVVDGGDVSLSVDLANTGGRDGREVVQVYLETPPDDLVRAPRALVAFGAAHLAAGERRTIELTVDRRALQVWDPSAAAWVTRPGRHVLHVGRSSRDLRTSVVIDL